MRSAKSTLSQERDRDGVNKVGLVKEHESETVQRLPADTGRESLN